MNKIRTDKQQEHSKQKVEELQKKINLLTK
jgi:hypothetical protein